MKALIYISKPTCKFSHEDIRNLTVNAINSNFEIKVTGFLCFHHQTFLQYIEGKAHNVDELFRKICLDSKHTVDHYIFDDNLSKRRFPSWSMQLIDSEILSELGVETFIQKQMELLSSYDLDSYDESLIWRGVSSLAN